MGCALIEEVFVNFIGEDEYVMLDGNLGEGLEFVFGVDGTSGVGG